MKIIQLVEDKRNGDGPIAELSPSSLKMYQPFGAHGIVTEWNQDCTCLRFLQMSNGHAVEIGRIRKVPDSNPDGVGYGYDLLIEENRHPRFKLIVIG